MPRGAMAFVLALVYAPLAWSQESEGVFARAQDFVEWLFGSINSVLAAVIFFPIPPVEWIANVPWLSWTGITAETPSVPLIICTLVLGGIFFTFRYGWVNIRLFRHGIDVVRGRFDRPEHKGEVSHFQALTSALSATVGLGNIAGVAVAIAWGGPGAVFWMWVTAIFGMSMKFSSCTFAQLYRRIKPDGSVLGGPMVYLREGIANRHPSLTPLAVVFSAMFCIFTIFASIGGGNLFQGNQTYAIFVSQLYYQDGVLNPDEGNLAVSPAGSEMRLSVSSGEAVVLTSARTLAEDSLTEPLATPESNPRIDLVQFTSNETVDVKPGIASTDPTAPLPDKGAIALAQVRIEPGDTSVAAASITDLRDSGALAEPAPWVAFLAGLLLAVPVGLVLLGGIKRIGEVTARLVPAMCVFYCVVCITILIVNLPHVPAMFAHIFTEAFQPDAAISGGFIGVLVQGMRRAAFSNEAGLGSAAIAHAAAKTDEPVREGVVAMLGPFIDTIVVCTMTALAILVTDSHLINPDLEGVQITALAFTQLGALLPYFLLVAVFIFAFSTVISWGYYGERATEYLFGEKAIVVYRAVYVLMVILGPVLSLGAILDFGDLMILSMGFPNILGMMLISGQVKKLKDDYLGRLKSGAMKPVDKEA